MKGQFIKRLLGALCLLVIISNVQVAKAQTIVAQYATPTSQPEQSEVSEYPCLMIPNPQMTKARHGFLFNQSYGGFAGIDGNHHGFDWATGGTVVPLYAAYSGTITKKYDTYDEELWRAGGKLVWTLDPPFQDFVLMYFHLDYQEETFKALQEGQHIVKGQLIGQLGSKEKDPSNVTPDGRISPLMGILSSAPHLHEQMTYKGALIDPSALSEADCGQIALRKAEVAPPLTSIVVEEGYIDPLLGDFANVQSTSIEVTSIQPGNPGPIAQFELKKDNGEPVLRFQVDPNKIPVQFDWSKIPIRIDWEKVKMYSEIAKENKWQLLELGFVMVMVILYFRYKKRG